LYFAARRIDKKARLYEFEREWLNETSDGFKPADSVSDQRRSSFMVSMEMRSIQVMGADDE
jgi:hypothetical protein